MKNIKKISLLALLFSIPVILLLISNWKLVDFVAGGILNGPQRMAKEAAEFWTVSNGNFNIHIEKHLEEGGFMPAMNGAYYVYSSSAVNSENREQIMTVHHDDPNPIKQNSARFVSDDIAFVYFGSRYAVTKDAGMSWTIWNAWDHKEALEFDKYNLYGSITDVKIDQSGQGTMRLYSTSNKSIEQPVIKTSDFGVTWSLD